MPSYLALRSRTVHRMDRNVGSRAAFDSPGRIGRYRLAFRNDFSTYRREGLTGVAYYLGKWCKNMAEAAFLSKDRRISRMSALAGGFYEGLSFRPDIEYAETAGEG